MRQKRKGHNMGGPGQKKRSTRKRIQRAPKKNGSKRPDFLARLEKIYEGKRMKVTNAELLSRDRNRY